MSIRETASVTIKTTGCIPPKLMGASTTVAADCMYLFGGKADSQETFHMYIFNLTTQTWSNIPQPDGPTPPPRYLHSTDLWNGYLVIFGGIVINDRNESPYALDDIWFFSIIESRWVILPDTAQSARPLPRYGHLSSISADTLYVIGGQDKSDNWVDNIHVYDLNTRNWVHRCYIPYHCGTYRGLAASSNLRVIHPSEDGYGSSIRFKPDADPTVIPSTAPDSFVELTYSTPSTKEKPSEIHMYLNYDFTDLRRELRSFIPNSDPKSHFTLKDRTSDMYANLASTSSFPPALRFATGGIIGSHLVLSGIYITTRHTISAWALNLGTLTWTKIDLPTILSTGSWARSVVWSSPNKLVIFGSRKGDFKDDYQNRLLSWDDAVYIDLEAYGIYQPPSQVMTNMAKTIGLAALEDGAFADFEVICDDGRKIPCSRDLLERRWNWFHEERKKWDVVVSKTNGSSPVPSFETAQTPFPTTRPDPRLTPRNLHLPEPYPVVVAFLQYLYTQSLITPLQHAPAVLSSLMLLAATYEIPRLMDLLAHAMHNALSSSRSLKFASGIFDVASLVQRSGLRLRAFAIGRRPLVTLPTPPLESVRLHKGSFDEGHSHHHSAHHRPHQSPQLDHQNHHKDHLEHTGLKDEKVIRDKVEPLALKGSHNHHRYSTVPDSVPASTTKPATYSPSGITGVRNDRRNVEGSAQRKQEYGAHEIPVAAPIATTGHYDRSPQSRVSREVPRNERLLNKQPSHTDVQPVDSSSTIDSEGVAAATANAPPSQSDVTATDLQTKEMQLLELRYIVSETLRDVASGPYWRLGGTVGSNGNRVGLGLNHTNGTATKRLSIGPSTQKRDDSDSSFHHPKIKDVPSTSSAFLTGGLDGHLGFGMGLGLSLGSIPEEHGSTNDKGKGKEIIRDEDGPTPQPYPSPISASAAVSSTYLPSVPAKQSENDISASQPKGAQSGSFYHSSKYPAPFSVGSTNASSASGSNINGSKTANHVQADEDRLYGPTRRLSLKHAPAIILPHGQIPADTTPLNSSISSKSPNKLSPSKESPIRRPLPRFPLTPPLTEVGRSISSSPAPPSGDGKQVSTRVDNERKIMGKPMPEPVATSDDVVGPLPCSKCFRPLPPMPGIIQQIPFLSA